MSVLSMLALRMVTQEGLQKCLRIHEELRRNDEGEKSATPAAASTPETRDAKPQPASGRSAKRRIRRRKLKESRRGGEGNNLTKELWGSTKECRDETTVDATSYGLVTHADKRTSRDFLERSLMAAFLLRCLQRVGFFARPTPDDGTYDWLFFSVSAPMPSR
jgi:hypothetical protein